MGNNVEVVFSLERTPEGLRGLRKEGAPVGPIDGIRVVGHGEHNRWRLDRRLRVATELPLLVAVNILNFHRQHTERNRGRYNGLSFMAASQGWPVGENEFFVDEGPNLAKSRFEGVDDVKQLKPGEAYGILDENERLVHGIVGLTQPNRHLDVHGSAGFRRVSLHWRNEAHMRFGRTTDTILSHLGYLQRPGEDGRPVIEVDWASHLIRLEEGNYKNSEIASNNRPAPAIHQVNSRL